MLISLFDDGEWWLTYQHFALAIKLLQVNSILFISSTSAPPNYEHFLRTHFRKSKFSIRWDIFHHWVNFVFLAE